MTQTNQQENIILIVTKIYILIVTQKIEICSSNKAKDRINV